MNLARKISLIIKISTVILKDSPNLNLFAQTAENIKRHRDKEIESICNIARFMTADGIGRDTVEEWTKTAVEKGVSIANRKLKRFKRGTSKRNKNTSRHTI